MLARQFAEPREETATHIDQLRDLVDREDGYRALYVDTALDQIDMDEEGMLSVARGGRLAYVQEVQERLARAIGMPISYGYAIPFDLFRHNFNRLKAERSVGLTLCVVRDTVVGLGPPRYAPARTADLLQRLDLNPDLWTCRGLRVSDFGVDIDLVIPHVTVEPQPGDVVEVGFRVSNSETGGHALQAVPYSLRLLCTNGAVHRSSQGVLYYEKLRKRTYEASLRAFCHGLRRLRLSAEGNAAAMFRGVAGRQLVDSEFVSLFRGLQRRLHSVEEAERILGAEPEERRELQLRVRERDRTAAPEPTRFGFFETHNRITAEARLRKFQIRQSLEELGGGMLVA